MATVELNGVTKQFGTQVVLDDVSLVIHPGETVGLIGANGAGKTTLFRIIAGLLAPDMGTMTSAKRTAIGLLAQEPDLDLQRTLHDEVACVFDNLLAMEKRLHNVSQRMGEASERGENVSELMAEYDRLHHLFDAAGGHRFQIRVNEILGGLGFSNDEHGQKIGELSGGQRCRAALAKLLLQDRELLLLDEPTNHLDIDAVRWLERFLETHQGSAFVVSHDRYLLDRICTRIVEVEKQQVRSFPGNYSNYAETKELRLLTEQRQFVKDAAFIKKERAFIAKHLAGQRTKEAQGRRKRLERRLSADEFVTEKSKAHRSIRLGFGDAQAPTHAEIRCDELTMQFGDRRLFTDLSLQIPAGQRFAITGPNGTGKTTLLNILLGRLSPVSGTVTLPSSLSFAYYTQQSEHLDPERTVLDEIRKSQEAFSEFEARSYAARFRFPGDEVFKKLGSLSGGEQSRVRLATLILQQPDVLVLDEPTNHLDIPSREVLEEALQEFNGTILVISHDRYFLDRIAERLLVLRREGHRVIDGNYSAYIEQLERESTTDTKGTPRRSAPKPVKAPVEKPPPSRFNHLSVEQLEEMVIEQETELAAIQESFGDAEVYKDPDKLAELRERQAEIERELAEVDRAWQDRADAD